ncbi:small ribosomal subunit protein bS21m [Monosporozyma unispora]
MLQNTETILSNVMWKQVVIIRNSASGRLLLQRPLSSLNSLLLQQGQGDNTKTTTTLPGFSNNPLRDFTLHQPTVNGDRQGLKINLNGLDNSTSSIQNNEAGMKEKLDKALLLENSDIRETALSTKFGPLAGRTVDVINGDTATAFRRLDSIISSNQVWKDRRDQRFHMKPGKKKELKRSTHHRKIFMKGFKRLMDVVKDANRKGY